MHYSFCKTELFPLMTLAFMNPLEAMAIYLITEADKHRYPTAELDSLVKSLSRCEGVPADTGYDVVIDSDELKRAGYELTINRGFDENRPVLRYRLAYTDATHSCGRCSMISLLF